jgi:hypothetical protein
MPEDYSQVDTALSPRLRRSCQGKNSSGSGGWRSVVWRHPALRRHAKRANMGESRGMDWVGPPMRPEAESRRKMAMEAES